MTEKDKDHGDEYLDHLWELAQKTAPLETASGSKVYVTTNRAQSVEAKTALKITTRSNLVIVAVAFSAGGELVDTRLLLEKTAQEYRLNKSGLATSPVMRVDWDEVDTQARDWAKTL